MEQLIGSESQKTLVEKFSKYVSAPKVNFFSQLGLDVIQGKREGFYIQMLEGKENQPPLKLFDCRTSGGVYNLGHRHHEILASLKEGIDLGLDIGDHHLLSEQRALLAEKLAELLPGDITKTQFCATGGEAVDLAIKLARGYTKRRKIVSATVGYHGVTGLSLAAGHKKFKETFLWELDEFIQIPFGDVDELDKVLNDDVAAIILETIPATGGILIADQGYFSRVRELCDQYGIIMISDEVQTGLGRTGQMWGIYKGLYEDEAIVPDIIVLAKGMSAGMYPLATCSYRPFLETIFEKDPFLHISTTGGAELGCHVTKKMLEIVSEPSFLENVRSVGNLLKIGLEDLKSRYSFIFDVRGRGLMWGIEFLKPEMGLAFTKLMVYNGIFADYCGNQVQTIKLMPPLIIQEEDVSFILTKLDKALSELLVLLHENE